MAQALALVVGLLTSLIAWWLVARYFTPRLAISEIARAKDPKGDGGWRYHLKVANRTRHPVAEFSVDILLVLPGLNRDMPEIEMRYRIPLGPGPVYSLLEARESVLMGLRVSDLEGRLEWLPSDVRERLVKRAVPLEELLALGRDASIRVAVQAAHHLSGNRRTYSLQYGPASIQSGIFRSGLSIQIVPTPAGSA